MKSTQTKTAMAAWIPGWYELDQPIAAGMTGNFWFFDEPPSQLDIAHDMQLVFYNGMAPNRNSQVRSARIVSITHSVLGAIESIETEGLDYVFRGADGVELIVNAEEDPGTIQSAGPANPKAPFDDWTMTVELADLSEPLGLDL